MKKHKIVLDIGSGSGIQAETALNSKAKSVLATDINPESIKLLRSKKINAINSNLFTKVKGKFDLIIFNPPYLPLDKREDKEAQLFFELLCQPEFGKEIFVENQLGSLLR
jgi:release factor glutamine methyltransferase